MNAYYSGFKGPPGEFGFPFGYPDPYVPPHKLSEVQAQRPLSQVWLLTDADQEAVTNPANTWRAQLPVKPVHGSVRNYVYFDGHVGAARVKPRGDFEHLCIKIGVFTCGQRDWNLVYLYHNNRATNTQPHETLP